MTLSSAAGRRPEDVAGRRTSGGLPAASSSTRRSIRRAQTPARLAAASSAATTARDTSGITTSATTTLLLLRAHIGPTSGQPPQAGDRQHEAQRRTRRAREGTAPAGQRSAGLAPTGVAPRSGSVTRVVRHGPPEHRHHFRRYVSRSARFSPSTKHRPTRVTLQEPSGTSHRRHSTERARRSPRRTRSSAVVSVVPRVGVVGGGTLAGIHRWTGVARGSRLRRLADSAE